ncbi:iron complex outermembrane recepter protein [Draconibacterium orientale]|uniref:Iron complex outermembrane recepter protein n=1 Tax=Draconibacterium orientale TaxID=1168034 RepID=A0A1I0JUJ4_9BACT|nr:TonB-dependent receptor [Draconibacterium orientale]SEU14355.1 iron complex outermembrane recepter protein [Draconibacterium orientale]
MKKIEFKLLVFAILLGISFSTIGQTPQITGVVFDENDNTIPGVSIVEKGTTNGTVTDMDGKFIIGVEGSSKTLVFSFVGYKKQEIVLSDQTNYKVHLVTSNIKLDEVVAIGYGKLTRKDVTSSITTVNAKDLNVGVYTDPSQLLQGKVPGLTITQTSDPNGKSSITLRGASTLRTGEAQEPYYVIDGIPGMSLSLIAPEDIESIDVLRDASATAIYGSKAANGVIIVTTKKGSKNGQTNVSYSSYVAVDNVLKNLDMMTASELSAYAASNNVSLPNNEGASTDWQKEVQRTGFSHNHNISINGGDQKTSYNASINYMNKQGVIRKTDIDRLIARSFLQTTTLDDRLTLSLGFNGSITNNYNVSMGDQGTSVLDAMNYYSPLVPTRNENGSWYQSSGISQNYNPLSILYEDQYNTESKRLQGVTKASLKIIDGLVYNLGLSYQNEQYIHSNYNTSASQIFESQNGQASRTAVENKKKVMETYLNYDKVFKDTHKLGLMAGYSWEQNDNNDGFGLTVYNFYNDALKYYNLGYANNMDISGINSGYTLSTLRMISFYGRVNYSYNSKYLFQATLRRDGSSAFGKNNRWATFPSASLSWRLNEEDFIKNMNVFDDLKFRIGYGVSGNSLGFDAFTAIQTYGASGWFTYTDANGNTSQYRTLAATSNANPDLKWERTGMLNVGIDFGFFKNRLTGTLEYYDKQTKDLIYSYAVSTNRYPFGSMLANVGDISNKGIELSVNVIPVQTKNMKWETSLNLSHNKNEVKSLSNQTYSVDYINAGNPNIGGYSTANVQRIMEGEAIGTFYTWEWAGYNENGVSQFYVHDPETGERTGEFTTSPQETDRTKVGSAQPKVIYGWNNTLSYKKWSLNAFFQGVTGNKIMNSTRAQYNYIALVSTGKNVLSEVAANQKYTDVNAQTPSDRYLENGSYLRLSTLSLSYDFGKVGNYLNGLRVYATCNNLFTLTNYKGLDPEVSLGGLTPGIDSRETYYPRTRTFMLGLNINF